MTRFPNLTALQFLRFVIANVGMNQTPIDRFVVAQELRAALPKKATTSNLSGGHLLGW